MKENLPVNIAVIDDDMDTRELISMALEIENYQCTTFESAVEFLEFLKKNPPPQLLFCDLFMPNMNGAELIRHLSSVPEYARIKTVLLSGASDIKKRLSDLSAEVILSKPVSVDVLLNTVKDQVLSLGNLD